VIAWIIGIITAILLFFMIWRRFSKDFRERCERPKYLFLQRLGVSLPADQPDSHKTNATQEDIDDSPHS
jgi:hypothetical protein